MKRVTNKLFTSILLTSFVLSGCNNTPIDKYATITWLNYDNTVLYIEEFKLGELPSYNHPDPIKEEDELYTYTFNGWSPTLEVVSSDISYTATYLSVSKIHDGINFISNGASRRIVSLEDLSLIDSFEEEDNLFKLLFTTLARYELEDENSFVNSSIIKPFINYSEIKQEAKDSVASDKEAARDRAKQEGTTYEEELKRLLIIRGVSSLEELEELYINEICKNVIVEWYFDNNVDQLLEEFVSLDPSLIGAAYPYHLKHIFASIEVENKITPDTAHRIASIIKALKEGDSFIDLPFSDSTSSSNKSVGIMSSNTSFYSEIRLSTYMLDALLNKGSTKLDNFKTGLAMNSSSLIIDGIKTYGLDYVPYGLFTQLDNTRNVDEDNAGDDPLLKQEEYFPRNIYFNKYLNRHNLMVVSNDMVANNKSSTLSIYSDVKGRDFSSTEVDTSILEAEENKSGFRYVEGLSRDSSHLILTDEKGEPIYLTSTPIGIHVLDIEKSPFADDISTYYSLDPNEDIDSYINFVKKYPDSSKPLSEQLKEVKEAKQFIKYNVMSYLEQTIYFDIFNDILNKEEGVYFESKLETFVLSDVISDISDYYSRKSLSSKQDKLVEEWMDYLNMLSDKDLERSSLIPERYVFDYNY